MPALQRLSSAVAKADIPETTRYLVQLRASQINGCAVCVDMHSREMRIAGEPDERIFTVATWRDVPYFTDAERATLALTEAATRLADRPNPVPDDVWQEAARHYEEPELAALVVSNANLWRKVIERLANRFTCIALDLPFGAHRVAMDPDADLSPAGCGDLIASTLSALGLNEVTLVGNDSGGAYSQIAVASVPHRVARLVLNSCETPYSEFPPPPFDGLPVAARDPETLRQLLEALRDREIRLTPPAFGLLIKHPIEDIVSDSYALPCLSDTKILRDTSKVMSSANSVPVREAGRRLIAEFNRPVLFVWSPEDRVFAPADAKRYCEALHDGRLALIEDAYSFTPEDQPERLAEEIARFAVAQRRGTKLKRGIRRSIVRSTDRL